MAQGWVTTARGESLNIDALKDAASMPLVKAKQTKTTVPKRDYRTRKPINIRGFQPEGTSTSPSACTCQEVFR